LPNDKHRHAAYQQAPVTSFLSLSTLTTLNNPEPPKSGVLVCFFRDFGCCAGVTEFAGLDFEGPKNFKARNLKDWILADQIVRVDFDGPAF